MIPPILRRLAKQPIGRAGRRSEKRVAKQLGARQTPASGAMVGAKGDIEHRSFLLEAKSTICESLSLKLDWLAKISGEARAVGKTPAVTIDFVHGDGEARVYGEWVLVPAAVFRELADER